MAAGRYRAGAAALGRSGRREGVGDAGSSAWEIFVPFGVAAYADSIANPPQTPGYGMSAPQSGYWAYQRAASRQNPFAVATAGQLAQGQQLRQVLLQQQQANLASLRQQLAQYQPQSVPGAGAAPGYSPGYSPYAPPSPAASGAGVPPSLSPDDSAQGGAPDSSTWPSDVAQSQSVVGASWFTTPGAPASASASTGQGQYVVIKVNNFGDVIKKQAAAQGYGTVANLAYSAAPSALTAYALGKMRDEMQAKLAAEGVDADVQVAGAAPSGSGPRMEFLRGAVAGAATVGAGWALYKLAKYLIGGLG